MMFQKIAAAAATFLALLATPALAQAPKPAPLTILVSLDGFRADYLQRGVTPNLAALAADGVRAEAMHPSYPSLTFPNHYTLVTGLRPDHHGVVGNTMIDLKRPGVVFAIGKRELAHDPFWWDGAEPLWVTAENQGVRTATMFWPGSDAPIRGVQPHDWKLFDETFPADGRVDQVLDWLKRPPAERPRFVTLYLNEVDSVGHRDGPDSRELNEALKSTDASIGRLVAGLKAQGLFDQTDLVIVADHGMAPISRDRVIVLDDIMPHAEYRAISVGAEAGIIATPKAEAELLKPHPHMTCWRKADVPARFHYGRNPRVPPDVCLAETGWLIEPFFGPRQKIQGGTHGYDPDDPLMAALFVAHGPAFRKGVVQPAFDNVDVYPLVAALTGVKPQPNDGHLADLAPSLIP
jgi:predicted AlkP superfamily pyrophosphatase or phosphodiesterase